MPEHSSSHLASRSFINRWLHVLGRAILDPIARRGAPYRSPTPARRNKGGGWRSINPDASWAGKAAARRHAKWTKDVLEAERGIAALNAANHARGETVAKPKSNRTVRRELLRASAKHMGV